MSKTLLECIPISLDCVKINLHFCLAYFLSQQTISSPKWELGWFGKILQYMYGIFFFFLRNLCMEILGVYGLFVLYLVCWIIIYNLISSWCSDVSNRGIKEATSISVLLYLNNFYMFSIVYNIKKKILKHNSMYYIGKYNTLCKDTFRHPSPRYGGMLAQ